MPDAPRRRGAARTPAAPPAPAAGAAQASGAPPSAGTPTRGGSRTLSDGRVQMLVYLPPALVKAVKHAALDQDVSASHVVEQALAHWLAPTEGTP